MSKDMCPSDQEIEGIFRMARESAGFFGGLAKALGNLERAEWTFGTLLAGWAMDRERRSRWSNGRTAEPAPLDGPLRIFDPVGLAFALHTTMRGDHHAAVLEQALPDTEQSERLCKTRQSKLPNDVTFHLPFGRGGEA